MIELRGWRLPEQHLLPDAVVAFVDGELSMLAYDRVAAHIARCPLCAEETRAQRQARAEVQSAAAPSPRAALLAALQAIPADINISLAPDCLAVTEDGQLVARQRPDQATRLGNGPRIGSSRPLGGR